MAQQAKDPALSLQQLGFLLWHRLDPWPRNFYMPQCKKKKKKEKKSLNFHVNPIIYKADTKKKKKQYKIIDTDRAGNIENI